MEPVLDEASSAGLHVWISFMRLLLQVHPRVGADEYGRVIGQTSPMDARPGWNCIHRPEGAKEPVAYIWIGAETKEGRYTLKHPDVPDDQIHHVHEEQMPAFEDTPAWRAMRQLTEILSKQPDMAAMTERHWTVLSAAAQVPLRGPDESVDARIVDAFNAIRKGIDASGAQLAVFETPLRQVVDDYLGLRITRRTASNIAAVLFARLALTIPAPDPASKTAALTGQIDHLIDLTSRIRDERHRYNLGTFYTLTCLGMFWSETAQMMAKQLAPQAPPALAKTLLARARYIEELAVHDLHPSLQHPFLLVPFGAAAYMTTTTRGLFIKTGLYEGAGVADPAAALQPQQIWDNLRKYSTAAKSIPVPWDAYTQILSKELTEHLQMFLLTMAMGRGAAGS